MLTQDSCFAYSLIAPLYSGYNWTATDPPVVHVEPGELPPGGSGVISPAWLDLKIKLN
jgi:hypothetical protein